MPFLLFPLSPRLTNPLFVGSFAYGQHGGPYLSATPYLSRRGISLKASWFLTLDERIEYMAPDESIANQFTRIIGSSFLGRNISGGGVFYYYFPIVRKFFLIFKVRNHVFLWKRSVSSKHISNP